MIKMLIIALSFCLVSCGIFYTPKRYEISAKPSGHGKIASKSHKGILKSQIIKLQTDDRYKNVVVKVPAGHYYTIKLNDILRQSFQEWEMQKLGNDEEKNDSIVVKLINVENKIKPITDNFTGFEFKMGMYFELIYHKGVVRKSKFFKVRQEVIVDGNEKVKMRLEEFIMTLTSETIRKIDSLIRRP